MSNVSKSPWVIHYDGSSCNGCDIEVLAALSPLYDAERFGVVNTGNPKHADILLVTGAVNAQNTEVLREIYDQMIEPKVVVACGICACSGGSGDSRRCVRSWVRDSPRDHHRCGGRGHWRAGREAREACGSSKGGLRAMQMAQHFEDISIDDILSVAEREHEAHSRFVQVLCINGEEGIDLVYSYQKTADQGYAVHNYRVHGVKPETHIPSVTKFYLVAFPFENEAHDLFGVQVDDIAIDFKGGFYKVAMDKPMTVISPAQKAAREKAAKLAAAKAAKAAKGEGAQAAPAIDWEAERAKVEAKCANLPEDKAAKVMAAFEAKVRAAQGDASAKGGE